MTSPRRPPLAAIARLLLLPVLVAGLTTGCMRGEEEEAARARAQREATERHNAMRRYELRNADGERVQQLKRRGPTWILDDEAGRALARVSVRRGTDRVVARDTSGRVVGHTRTLDKGRGIEIVRRDPPSEAPVDPDAEATEDEPATAEQTETVIGTLRPDTAGKRFTLTGADGQPIAVFVANATGDEAAAEIDVLEPTGPDATRPRFRVAHGDDDAPGLQVRTLDDTGKPTGKGPSRTLEPRSELTPLGLAVLHSVEALELPWRTALAVHVSTLGFEPSPTEADDEPGE